MKKQKNGSFLQWKRRKEIPIRKYDFNCSLHLKVFPTTQSYLYIILSLLMTWCFCCKDKQHMIYLKKLPIIYIYAVFCKTFKLQIELQWNWCTCSRKSYHILTAVLLIQMYILNQTEYRTRQKICLFWIITWLVHILTFCSFKIKNL